MSLSLALLIKSKSAYHALLAWAYLVTVLPKQNSNDGTYLYKDLAWNINKCLVRDKNGNVNAHLMTNLSNLYIINPIILFVYIFTRKSYQGFIGRLYYFYQEK